MIKLFLNIILFQIGWLVCVLGGNCYAMMYTAFALLLHHLFVLKSNAEWRLIIGAALLGCAWDALITYAGISTYTHSDALGLPIWLMCLWLLFASTLSHSLAWLHSRLRLASLLAAIFGPASYWAGARLDKVQLIEPTWLTLSIMALGWAILLPSIFKYIGRANRKYIH